MAASLAHRNDDAIDVFSFDNFVELLSQADHSRIDQALAQQVGVSTYKTDDTKARIGTIQHLARNFDGEIAGPDYQDALAKVRVAQKPVNRYAP